MNVREIEPYVRYISELRYPTAPSPNWMYATDKPFCAYDARLLYCLSGTGEIEVDGKRYSMHVGSVIIWQRGMVYRYLHSQKRDMAVFRVNFDYTYDYALSEPLPIPPVPAQEFRPERLPDSPKGETVYYLEDAHALEPILRLLLESYEGNDVYKNTECSGLMKCVLSKVLSACEKNCEKKADSSSLLAKKVCGYIDTHACSLSSVREISASLSYHPNYLNRVVLKETGKSLHMYLVYAKIQQAAKLLAAGNTSVACVAEQCGFYDSSHFAKKFKAVTGYLPSQYRRL